MKKIIGGLYKGKEVTEGNLGFPLFVERRGPSRRRAPLRSAVHPLMAAMMSAATLARDHRVCDLLLLGRE
jgi:hypothetical protein